MTGGYSGVGKETARVLAEWNVMPLFPIFFVTGSAVKILWSKADPSIFQDFTSDSDGDVSDCIVQATVILACRDIERAAKMVRRSWPFCNFETSMQACVTGVGHNIVAIDDPNLRFAFF